MAGADQVHLEQRGVDDADGADLASEEESPAADEVEVEAALEVSVVRRGGEAGGRDEANWAVQLVQRRLSLIVGIVLIERRSLVENRERN